MTNSLSVAKKGNKVVAPVEFTGVTRSVKPIVLENGDKVASFDIEGLPALTITTKNGEERKATILRTREQLVKDLGLFADASASMDELILNANILAKKREITLRVSAHEAGALTVVTENSKFAIANGAEVGSEVETTAAGFYTEGFLDIDISVERQLARAAEMKADRLAAKAESLD